MIPPSSIWGEYFPQKSFQRFSWPWRVGFYTDPSGNLTSTGVALYNAIYFTAGTSFLTDFGDVSLSGEFGTKDYAATSVGSSPESVFRVIASMIYRF